MLWLLSFIYYNDEFETSITELNTVAKKKKIEDV